MKITFPTFLKINNKKNPNLVSFIYFNLSNHIKESILDKNQTKNIPLLFIYMMEKHWM